ncbi:hypothetical protein ABL78_2296 [Leptomonas seymouri]|uniref:Uncharacterized protein n=1 Tax=Leptomonas seymouri TaxID=5684 RepID=A0A0N1IM04_LEPSE|nr:hypothetical protein ABL78_2296 [Leptomonas seymouri]|eukprot:KPI88628.1 hypothetical protein ABL78_2296 [Leptomonas seymouri]
MVKKSDTYARVLRPGESMMLGRKFSDFEIVLFRPKQHVRLEEGQHSDQQPEADAFSPDRASTSKDSVSNPSGGTAGPTGNKVTFALGPGFSETSHADRKKNGVAAAIFSAAGGLTRDAAPEPLYDEGTGPLTGKRGSNACTMVRFADFAVDAPLFFDTTVCIFYDELTKMDYVATGRSTADSKGIHYIPHLVVLGDEVGSRAYCNYNITRPNGESLLNKTGDVSEEDDDVFVSRNAANSGPTTMAAADGVSVNLRRLGTCAGFLVCATLFGKDACLNRERNVFYMIRKPRSSSPFCLVPLCVSGGPSKSCISLMVRKIKVQGDSTWEVVNVNEGLALQDVKSLVLKLQKRGLKDPAHFTRDFELKSTTKRANDGAYGGGEENVVSSSSDSSSSELDTSFSQKRLSEAPEQEHSFMSDGALPPGEHHTHASQTRGGRTFSGLLVDVPRVAREGRRQYNVGRSHVQSNLFDGDTSEEDEVLDDAMRAVVPCYANTSLIRYDNGAYNVGSKVDSLVTHYIDHRETYGFDAAGHRLTGGSGSVVTKDGVSKDILPPLLGAQRGQCLADWSTPIPVLDRCQIEEEDSIAARPELPPDLLVTSQDRRLAAAMLLHRSSISPAMKRRQSALNRRRGSSSRRSSVSRKRTPRPRKSAGKGRRKKANRKAARTKSASAHSAGRAGEGRGSDGMPGRKSAAHRPHSSPSRPKRPQAKARPSRAAHKEDGKR